AGDVPAGTAGRPDLQLRERDRLRLRRRSTERLALRRWRALRRRTDRPRSVGLRLQLSGLHAQPALPRRRRLLERPRPCLRLVGLELLEPTPLPRRRRRRLRGLLEVVAPIAVRGTREAARHNVTPVSLRRQGSTVAGVTAAELRS